MACYFHKSDIKLFIFCASAIIHSTPHPRRWFMPPFRGRGILSNFRKTNRGIRSGQHLFT